MRLVLANARRQEEQENDEENAQTSGGTGGAGEGTETITLPELDLYFLSVNDATNGKERNLDLAWSFGRRSILASILIKFKCNCNKFYGHDSVSIRKNRISILFVSSYEAMPLRGQSRVCIRNECSCRQPFRNLF